jgi:hypothetical protein
VRKKTIQQHTKRVTAKSREQTERREDETDGMRRVAVAERTMDKQEELEKGTEVVEEEEEEDEEEEDDDDDEEEEEEEEDEDE